MFRVALTGGIASGKSAVAELFAGHGATVIDADRIAHEIVEPGRPALAALTAALGKEIIAPDGSLDRARLRRRLFAEPPVRRQVEGIMHPAIQAELEQRARTLPGAYQVLVIPLLAETGRKAIVDRVLVVDCPEETQLARLMRRDGESEESARRALASQASRAARLELADDVIDNSGPQEALTARVAALDRQYRAMAAK